MAAAGDDIEVDIVDLPLLFDPDSRKLYNFREWVSKKGLPVVGEEVLKSVSRLVPRSRTGPVSRGIVLSGHPFLDLKVLLDFADRVELSKYYTEVIIPELFKEVGPVEVRRLFLKEGENKPNKVKLILNNVQLTQEEKDNTLSWAARYGHLEIVRFLVANGADIHADNDRALIFAARYGHLPVVQFLVENEANIHAIDDAALEWAAHNGHLPVVQFLVANGANIHVNNENALNWAAHNGHLPVVRFLVENGADIHAGNDQALISAAMNRHQHVVDYLRTLP